MFNVYPYEIRYTRTDSRGVLRGIPCKCTVGVANEHEGCRLFEQMVSNNPSVAFSNFEMKAKKLAK